MTEPLTPDEWFILGLLDVADTPVSTSYIFGKINPFPDDDDADSPTKVDMWIRRHRQLEAAEARLIRDWLIRGDFWGRLITPVGQAALIAGLEAAVAAADGGGR